jgi:hypothetical protein
MVAQSSAPTSALANNAFFQLSVTGRIGRSTVVLVDLDAAINDEARQASAPRDQARWLPMIVVRDDTRPAVYRNGHVDEPDYSMGIQISSSPRPVLGSNVTLDRPFGPSAYRKGLWLSESTEAGF